MKLYTIGFTRISAEAFFGKLVTAGVARVLDTRIRRDGQLSGFAKAPDFAYFLKRLTNIAYEPWPALAPTAAMLAAYRATSLRWDDYAASYAQLLLERSPERDVDVLSLDRACLLCSEASPVRCHRRLAAEYLRAKLADTTCIEIVHL